MSYYTLSPNMSLPVPTVSREPGPDYAIDVNACLALIDSHNHSAGSGSIIGTAGISIDGSLALNSHNLTSALNLVFTSQVTPPTDPLIGGSLQVVGADLYYTNTAGTSIRITQAGSIVGTAGSITGLNAPATASFVALTGKFVWQQDVNKAADMDFAAAIMRNTTASSYGLTLQPSTLTANYAITLPLLPASQKIMTLDNTGAMTAPYTVDGSTIQIASNVIQRPAVGQQVSASSGVATPNATTIYTDIANLTVTIASIGTRPIMVGLMPDGSGNPSAIAVRTPLPTAARISAFFTIVETITSTSVIAELENDNGGAATPTLRAPPGTLNWLFIPPSAGTYTFKVQFKVFNTSAEANCYYAKLYAYSL